MHISCLTYAPERIITQTWRILSAASNETDGDALGTETRMRTLLDWTDGF